MAANIATKMLPQVFRADSPVFEVVLSPEKQRQLENLVSNIEHDVFKASDSIGWAYQFWQTNKKKEVNDSGVKIGGKELPAVTQLFTEPYMVSFLLDNTLGAWLSNKRLDHKDLSSLPSEEDLRKKCNLPSVPLKYLRFVRDDDGIWTPIGGFSEDWPEELSELKIIDPTCGSGHFLVAAFLMLVPIRMELEGLTEKEACDLVLRENLHGLEIDKRCVELAAFALALAAWKYPNTGGFRKLPELQLAWCGQPINYHKEDWLALANDDTELKIHMGGLFELFREAQLLGSLINPRNYIDNNTLFSRNWGKVSIMLQAKLDKRQSDRYEIGVVAQGIDKAFHLLGNDYHWVITNVPYLLSGKQVPKLQDYCAKNYPESKSDLATVFLERSLEFCKTNGYVSLVLPQNWLYLKSYEQLRVKLLERYSWKYLVRLGAGAFSTISGEVVKAILFSLINRKNNSETNKFASVDLSQKNTILEKDVALRNNEFIISNQLSQLLNPDARIVESFTRENDLLSKFADVGSGMSTFDREKYIFSFWELFKVDNGWEYMQSTPDKAIPYSGMTEVVKWQDGEGELFQYMQDKEQFEGYKSGIWKAGTQFRNLKGIVIRLVGNLPSSIFTGSFYDQSSAVIIPKKNEYYEALWCYCSSKEFNKDVRRIDQSLKVTSSTVVKVPFDYEYWGQVATKKYPNGLPKPYTDDPTQWIFHGQPRKSVEPLQVAVARLLGYRWPAELDDEMELSDEARDLVAQSQSLLPYADKDGIVCIPSVRGESPASERLLNLLATAYKDEDINMKLPELLSNADHAGKSLESWLRDKFFTQHYKLFCHRPFIWQIWDGLKDGFSVLVNYHKLDRKKLETLIYTYLGDWISKQKSAMVDGIEGAEEKLNAAISLKKKLELILEGEAPYDIFVRCKPLNKQPLGWDPDINDGVRVNIRPFMLVGDVGKKGAGILRDKPNIKWTKDRGKDTENSPWYHLFGGDRINDHHLTLEEKKKAREEMR